MLTGNCLPSDALVAHALMCAALTLVSTPRAIPPHPSERRRPALQTLRLRARIQRQRP
jgi:hypothetical protein